MTSATVGGGLRERRNTVDMTGVAVLTACAVWALLTAAARGGRPEGVLLAVLALAAGYAGGRVCGAVLPVGTCALAALAGLGLAVAACERGLPGNGTGSPLGHTGAAAALLILSAGAACCGAWASARPAVRLGLRLLAVGIAAVAAVLGSTAALAGCTAVILCSLAAALMRRRGVGLAGLALTAALVVAASWAVAKKVLPEGLAVSLEGQLTRHRIVLWQDALALAEHDPVLGVGPGRYGEFSNTAQQALHPDGRPHSAPLQQAAEQGLFGVLLLGAVFCWLLYALWRSPHSTPVALTAGAALTALAAVAVVGNALSFAPVTAGTGLLAGLATAHPWAEDLSPELPDTTDGPLGTRP
ncbi:O-antigen ligase family protein [Streptomyces monticola]|uniref:O-antigen ligase family protein n=1 Tax=Streptomyces monticola TaxID=2666263 RepID=A0ABW2JR84_9ACTN